MTTDLWMLVAAAALQWILIMTAATPKILSYGLPWAVGNRAEEPEPAAWVARADRLSANMLENLPIFAVLVLVVHVSGSADGWSEAGAITFLGARVAHAVVYLIGIPWARTLIWSVSVVGMGLVAAALFV